MDPIQLPAQMQPVMRRKDGSVTLKLVSAEEISSEQLAHIDSYREVNGYLLFSPEPIKTVAEQPKFDWKEAGHTNSQRLRLALRALHLERGGTDEDFDPFYNKSMDTIIKSVTSQLEQ